MANSFLTTKNIARRALPRLIENLVFPNLIYRDYSDDFEVGKGDTIQVRKPVVLTASDFDANSGVTAQDVSEKSVDVKLDKLASVDVEFGVISSAVDVDSLDRLFIEPAAAALAEKINSDGLSLYADIPYYTGTAGTTPDDLEDIANAAKTLDENKAPQIMRNGVWSPAAMAKFRQVAAIVNSDKSGSTMALRAGSIASVFGIDNYMAQGVKKHVNATVTAGGTSATGVKVKTAVTGSASFVLISNATSGGTLTGAYSKGTLLSVGQSGVVVSVKSASTASNEMSVTADRPVTLAANDAVTVIGDHTANLVFHPMAFAFVTRPLSAPGGVESYVTSFNGITLRVVRGYNMTYKKDVLSMDVLYGYKTIYPELAVRVLG